MATSSSTRRATTSATTFRTSTGHLWPIGSRRSSAVWDRFSPAEMERRLVRARALMGGEDLTALVVFGNSGVNRGNMANAFWLSNHLDLHHCYLLVPADPSLESALYTGLANHVPNAREVSEVPIVEWGGYDPAATVAARLHELGLTHGRAGLVGVNAKFSMGMPYGHYARLRAELPELELVDVTGAFQRLRAVKSEEEIAWLRKAAELTDRAIVALVEGARPGMTEVELVALTEAAYRPAGGMPRIMFLRSMAMDEPNGCLPAQNPSRRPIEAGDVINDALVHGYGVDTMPPVVDREQLRNPPTDGGARFERDSAIVIQPNPVTPDERMGLQLGELTVVRNEGAESLHGVPLEPLIAAA